MSPFVVTIGNLNLSAMNVVKFFYMLRNSQVWSREKAHELVEKVPKTQLDKLPEVAIFYRLQVFAREKRKYHYARPLLGGELGELLH